MMDGACTIHVYFARSQRVADDANEISDLPLAIWIMSHNVYYVKYMTHYRFIDRSCMGVYNAGLCAEAHTASSRKWWPDDNEEGSEIQDAGRAGVLGADF